LVPPIFMPSFVNTNTSTGDTVSAGSGQTASSRIEAGRIYTGVIKETFHGDNSYTVLIDKINANIPCRWAAGVFAPLVGLRTNYLPPLNSRVAVLASSEGPGWIISSIPSEPYDLAGGASQTMFGNDISSEAYEQKRKGLGLSTTKSNDLLEGEYELTNTFGVAVQLLTTLARIKGSERAKVETFLLDDMVRIVSEVFKHHSSFGDMQIYNDGGLNLRIDGTSYEHEAWGLEKATDEKSDLANKYISFDPEDTNANYIDTARWRFSHYLGYLGNFIHTFVTDPTTTLSSIASDALRSGKARVHINNDGAILMQSVTEIALERVCRIPVPIEKKRPEDPEGNKKEDFQNLEKSFLRIWDFGQDFKNAHHTAYQLRQYARWLSCFHSYSRFLQLDKDWTIPKETDIPDPSWFNKEQDVEDVNNGKTEYYDAYATFRIMRDGSIVQWDAYGSAISMVKGNIQISSSRHLELDAAGDIRINAGQNIYIKARRNIEVASIAGGLTLKARAWFKCLCEWGSIWLKSDAVDPLKESPPTAESDQDPDPEVMAAAVVIEASKGQTLLQSERRTTVSVIGAPDAAGDMQDTTASVVIQSSQQDVRGIGGRHAILKVLGLNQSKLILDCIQGKAVIINSMKTLVKSFLFDINSRFTLNNSILNVSELRSKRGHFSTIISGPPSNQGIDPQKQPPYCPHGGHITDFTKTNIEVTLGGDTSARDDYKTGDVINIDPYEDNGDPPHGPDWEFVKEETEYTYADGEKEEMFQPLAQQQLTLDNPATHDDWDWNSDNKLKEATRTNSSSLPYPGTAAQEKTYDGGESLTTPLDEDYKDQGPDKAKAMKDDNIKRKFLKNS